MKPIFTSLAPNTEWDDVWLATCLIFQPWRWRRPACAGRGAAVAKLEAEFEKWLPAEYVHATVSGRTALYAILRALALPPGSEVLLQAYTCVAVPDPVLWAGAKPVYVDCDESTYNMSPDDLARKITPRAKVLIIQHTFGLPADIDALLAIARKHNLFVIEDCAHALGATYKGQHMGTFGDAAFFSFGRDKVISSVFGGILAVKDKAIAREVREIIARYTMAPWSWVLQQLFHPITTTKAKTFYRVLGLGKAILSLAKTLRLISKAVYPEEKKGERPAFLEYRMPNALAILALHQFKKLERFNAHRKEIVALYGAQLTPSPNLRLPAPALTLPSPSGRGVGGEGRGEGKQHIYLRYTIQTPHATQILEEARKQNIFLGDWYRTPIAPAGVDYGAVSYTPGSCPVAEKLARESINLPTDIHIGKKEAMRIINYIQQKLNK